WRLPLVSSPAAPLVGHFAAARAASFWPGPAKQGVETESRRLISVMADQRPLLTCKTWKFAMHGSQAIHVRQPQLNACGGFGKNAAIFPTPPTMENWHVPVQATCGDGANARRGDGRHPGPWRLRHLR